MASSIFDPNFSVPRDVERIWAGRDRHYATGTSEPYDRERALKQMAIDGMSASESVLSRAVTAYGPRGRVIPGLIPKWPIGKFQERPWVLAQADEHERELAEHLSSGAVVDDLLARAHALENVIGDEDSQELQKLTKILTMMREVATNTSAVAAMLVGAFTLLDVLSDGKLDQVIVWCHVLPIGRPVFL